MNFIIEGMNQLKRKKRRDKNIINDAPNEFERPKRRNFVEADSHCVEGRTEKTTCQRWTKTNSRWNGEEGKMLIGERSDGFKGLETTEEDYRQEGID